MSYPAYLRGAPPTPASAPRTPMPSATTGASAYGPGLMQAEIGCVATFTVEALDPYGEKRMLGGDVVVARLMVGSDVTVEAFTPQARAQAAARRIDRCPSPSGPT